MKWFSLAWESSHSDRIDCSFICFNEIVYFHLKYRKIPPDFCCYYFLNFLYLNNFKTLIFLKKTHPLNYYLDFALSYLQSMTHFRSHFHCHYSFFSIPPFKHHWNTLTKLYTGIVNDLMFPISPFEIPFSFRSYFFWNLTFSFFNKPTVFFKTLITHLQNLY